MVKPFLKSMAVAASLLAVTLPVSSSSTLDNHGDDRLAQIIAGRSDAEKARDKYRHPYETLKLFGIKEGMTVIDALPGSWYGNIIVPLIGSDGTYIGASYGKWFFENQFKPEEVAEKWAASKERAAGFPERAKKYGGMENPPQVAYGFINDMPESLNETADAYVLFRALHHTNKWDPAIMESVAAEAFRVVKSGGIVGIVQHRAPESASDEWARGFKGYLKQSRVIEAFKAAGFTLENASEINANRKDQPGESDIVWRLLPSNKDSEEAKKIGESDRMTLVFRKP